MTLTITLSIVGVWLMGLASYARWLLARPDGRDPSWVFLWVVLPAWPLIILPVHFYCLVVEWLAKR